MKIDKKLIKELVESLNEFRLTELEYQEGDKKIKVSKWTPPSVEKVSTNVKSNTTKAVFNDDEIGTRIKSPIIGTAYLSPEPGAKQFIKVGDNVKKGQTIMIVEAMKTMNHIPSSGDGDVKEILVKDGQPVEFGQTLVLLK